MDIWQIINNSKLYFPILVLESFPWIRTPYLYIDFVFITFGFPGRIVVAVRSGILHDGDVAVEEHEYEYEGKDKESEDSLRDYSPLVPPEGKTLVLEI